MLTIRPRLSGYIIREGIINFLESVPFSHELRLTVEDSVLSMDCDESAKGYVGAHRSESTYPRP